VGGIYVDDGDGGWPPAGMFHLSDHPDQTAITECFLYFIREDQYNGLPHMSNSAAYLKMQVSVNLITDLQTDFIYFNLSTRVFNKILYNRVSL